MNLQSSRRIGVFILAGSIGVLSALAQQPAPAAGAAPGRGNAAGGGAGGAAPGGAARGGGGGGRGAVVQYTPAQLIALGSINTTAETVAVAAARTALTAATFNLPVNRQEIIKKADDLSKADLALAQKNASEFARATKGLNLTPEQHQALIDSNGLNRGGNTSPGATWAYEDYTGFTKIFDGTTMNGWSGETDGWLVADGALQFSTQRLPNQHHIVFTGIPGVSPILKDFDFKVELRVASTTGGYNGGIQYRSRLLSAARSKDGKARAISDPATMADPLGKAFPANITTLAAATAAKLVPAGAGNPWQVSGYQFDITGGNMGSLYEGQGRGVVVNAGEIVDLYPGGLKFVIGHTVDTPVSQYIKPQGEWNQLEVIARGNTLIHILNGRVITVTTDDDPVRRAYQGILSLQCEGGEVWYRNVYLKNLDPIVGNTVPMAARK